MPGKIQSAFYLSFNGNCKEAMLFYQKCFDGDLEIQLVEDAPHSEDLPDWMRKCVLQATLRVLGFTLIGTDLHEDRIVGNNVAIHLSLFNEDHFFYLLEQLSEHNIDPDESITAIRSGKKAHIKDRYGIQWMLIHYNPETLTRFNKVGVDNHIN